MDDSYLTPGGEASAVVVEKRSRFLAFAYHVDTAQQARDIAAGLAAKYHDARHVCWAYVLGADGSETYSTDNGEPSGTAGRPILGQIRSAGLTYVMVAVVRYFGGIKLGTPGLIAAYKASAASVLAETPVVSRRPMTALTVEFPYAESGKVMSLVKSAEAGITDRVMDSQCRLTLTLPCSASNELEGRLVKIDGVRVSKP